MAFYYNVLYVLELHNPHEMKDRLNYHQLLTPPRDVSVTYHDLHETIFSPNVGFSAVAT